MHPHSLPCTLSWVTNTDSLQQVLQTVTLGTVSCGYVFASVQRFFIRMSVKHFLYTILLTHDSWQSRENILR